MVRLLDPQSLVRLRHLTFDQYQQFSQPTRNADLPVAVVTIDEASLKAQGQWPWPRTVVAELVNQLTANGAVAIGFDMVFAEPDRLSPEQLAKRWGKKANGEGLFDKLSSLQAHDDVLATAIGQAPVVLGFIGTNAKSGRTPMQKSGVVFMGAKPHDFVASFENATSSLVKLQQKAQGTGALNWLPEHDQIIRKLPLLTRVGSRLYPALSVELLRVAQGARSPVVRSSQCGGPKQFVWQYGACFACSGVS